MTVRVRQYKRCGELQRGKWQVDVHVKLPVGGDYREQLVADSPSKVQAKAWAVARAHEVETLARQGLDAK